MWALLLGIESPWTLVLPLVWTYFPLSPQLCGGDFESQGEQAAAYF